MRPHIEDLSPHRPADPIDMTALLHAVGGWADATVRDEPDRAEPDKPATLIDANPLSLDGVAPHPVDGFVDGVQRGISLTYREQRPVVLAYAAAGAVDGSHRPFAVAEHLQLVSAEADRTWLQGLLGDQAVPIDTIDSDDPSVCQARAAQAAGLLREQVERSLTTDLAGRSDLRLLILDGSLLGRPHDTTLVGVAKTHTRRYLADERAIYRLPVGWRSPRFTIPPGAVGNAHELHSCYVRLADAQHRHWSYGLIRIEAYEVDLLEPVAAACLANRQRGGHDPRGDRHLAGVRAVERFLTARQPAMFSLSLA